MPQHTPVMYFYICPLCCCCWAPSLVGFEWSCLQDFSWPQPHNSLLESTSSKAVVNPTLNSHQSFVYNFFLWYKKLGSKLYYIYIFLSPSPHFLHVSVRLLRERASEPTPASAVLFSLSSPPFFSFIWVQLYLLCETTWVNGSVRPLEWIKVAFNYLHHWPYEAG